MRMTLLTTAVALALCVALCVYSLFLIHGCVDEMNAMCRRAEEMYFAGDIDGAAEMLREAGEYWSNARKRMETTVSHTLLMRVGEAEVEARANLKSASIYEFERSLAVLYNCLSDVHEREMPSVENIF